MDVLILDRSICMRTRPWQKTSAAKLFSLIVVLGDDPLFGDVRAGPLSRCACARLCECKRLIVRMWVWVHVLHAFVCKWLRKAKEYAANEGAHGAARNKDEGKGVLISVKTGEQRHTLRRASIMLMIVVFLCFRLTWVCAHTKIHIELPQTCHQKHASGNMSPALACHISLTWTLAQATIILLTVTEA